MSALKDHFTQHMHSTDDDKFQIQGSELSETNNVIEDLQKNFTKG